MIEYAYDRRQLLIAEKDNGVDVEFELRLLGDAGPHAELLKKVRYEFERNRVLTDVMFYVHANHVYQVVVRKDFYLDFLLSLFKYGLLSQISRKSSIAGD